MDFIVLAFATFAVTLMLVEADGPFGIFNRLRRKLSALRCILCTSVYVGAVFALTASDGFMEWLVLTLALAGAVYFMDRFRDGF